MRELGSVCEGITAACIDAQPRGWFDSTASHHRGSSSVSERCGVRLPTGNGHKGAVFDSRLPHYLSLASLRPVVKVEPVDAQGKLDRSRFNSLPADQGAVAQ